MLSTDAVVHELYEDREVVDAVTERFGEDVAQDGAVDRGVLAQRAFGTPEDRAWLEQLLWPRVGRRIVGWRGELEERTPPPRAAVIEVPLLFEAGMEGAFDAMGSGQVDLNWAKEHHSLWVEEEQSRGAAPASPPHAAPAE